MSKCWGRVKKEETYDDSSSQFLGNLTVTKEYEEEEEVEGKDYKSNL